MNYILFSCVYKHIFFFFLHNFVHSRSFLLIYSATLSTFFRGRRRQQSGEELLRNLHTAPQVFRRYCGNIYAKKKKKRNIMKRVRVPFERRIYFRRFHLKVTQQKVFIFPQSNL